MINILLKKYISHLKYLIKTIPTIQILKNLIIIRIY